MIDNVDHSDKDHRWLAQIYEDIAILKTDNEQKKKYHLKAAQEYQYMFRKAITPDNFEDTIKALSSYIKARESTYDEEQKKTINDDIQKIRAQINASRS